MHAVEHASDDGAGGKPGRTGRLVAFAMAGEEDSCSEGGSPGGLGARIRADNVQDSMVLTRQRMEALTQQQDSEEAAEGGAESKAERRQADAGGEGAGAGQGAAGDGEGGEAQQAGSGSRHVRISLPGVDTRL